MTGLPLTGGCNCRAVRFGVTAPLVGASYRHCKRCQRRSGTAASNIEAFAASSETAAAAIATMKSFADGDRRLGVRDARRPAGPKDLLAAVYHEARHAEQDFLIARQMARETTAAPARPVVRPAAGPRVRGHAPTADREEEQEERSTGAQEGEDGEHAPVVLGRLTQVELEEDLGDVRVDGLSR
jgi:hypothetical protein